MFLAVSAGMTVPILWTRRGGWQDRSQNGQREALIVAVIFTRKKNGVLKDPVSYIAVLLSFLKKAFKNFYGVLLHQQDPAGQSRTTKQRQVPELDR